MYDPLLNAFIAVADEGSFTKASEKLYVSPTGVMKKINALEDNLGVKLFSRTAAGVALTPAGKVIYRDAKFMIDFSKKSVAEAKAAETRYDTTFCVGTSLLNPAKPFMDLWYEASKNFPDYKLHLVPFEDDGDGIVSVIGDIGKKFDFIIGVCDSKTWTSLCNFLPLGRYKKMIAVARDHRLASRKSVKIEDLYGETLMMVKKGDSGVNDYIRHEIETNHPAIKIEDQPFFYDISVFNRAVETGNVLLTIECWENVHPALVTIPVEWNYSIPYGLLYAHEAPEDVLRFVETIRKSRGTEE